MYSKNNKKMNDQKQLEKVNNYGIKKFNAGTASVLIASAFMFLGGAAQAADTNKEEATVATTEKVATEKPTEEKAEVKPAVSEIAVETKEVAPIDEVKATIASFPGAVLEDDVANQIYPQAINAVGSRDTFVGRIRKDLDAEKGIHMWVVSDNLLKGAAWNSVQIAETLHERGLVRPTTELKFELK